MARLAIRMPKMSMTMTEGEVALWTVEVGAEVAVGDVVCEVMTDKVDMEVESTVSGTLVEIVVENGMADVGDPIGWVEGEDDGSDYGSLLTAPEPEPGPEDATAEPVQGEGASASESKPAQEAEPEAQSEPEPESVVTERAPQPEPEPESVVTDRAPEPEPESAPTQSGPTPAVPRARGLAREHGIDLATVTPSGPEGLVRVADVEALATPQAPTQPPSPPQSQVATRGEDGKAAARRTAVRRAVARVMVPTAAIPQFTVWREIHLDEASSTRDGLSWTTILLRAYAASLREVPELLSRWEDDAPATAGPPCLALAVATDRGLLVPTFVEPDLGDARDTDAEIRDVIKAAQGGKVDGPYLGEANGSLSNLGGLGVDRFQALLTPPQATVLSLGSIRPRPVAVTGGVGLALTVEAGITVDHRVADGAHGAALLAAFARHLGAAT